MEHKNINLEDISISEPVYVDDNNSYVSKILYNDNDINDHINLIIENANIIKNIGNELMVEIKDPYFYNLIYHLDNTILTYIINNSERLFGGKVDSRSINNMLIRSFRIPEILGRNPYMVLCGNIPCDNRLYNIGISINGVCFYKNRFHIIYNVNNITPFQEDKIDIKYQLSSEPDDLTFDFDVEDDDASVILTECFRSNN